MRAEPEHVQDEEQGSESHENASALGEGEQLPSAEPCGRAPGGTEPAAAQ